MSLNCTNYHTTFTSAQQHLGQAALALTLAATPAFADEPVSQALSGTDEIYKLPGYEVKSSHLYTDQINALKTPTPIINVPQSLTVTTSEDISYRGFDSLSDIVEYTPGVNMSMGEGHRDAVVFRGVRSTADFFVDGVRDDVQYYRPLYNVEQVEILRGPNALFFGRGGAGGILNRVMKKGQIGQDFDAYTFGFNTFGAADAQWDKNITINDNAAFRVTAFYERLDNHRDFFDGDRIGINPTFRFQLAEGTTLDLSYEYMDHERFIDRGIPTGADGEPVERFEDIVFGDPDVNKSTLEGHVFKAFLQRRFSDVLKGNLTASYGDYDKYYANFYASGYDELATPRRVTLDGYVDETSRQNFVLSGNLIGEFETGNIGHTVIVGAERIDTSSNQDRFNSFWNTTADDNEVFRVRRPLRLEGGMGFNADGVPTMNDFWAAPNDFTKTDLEVYSLFVQDEIQLLEQLTVVLGLRYDSFRIDVDDVLNNNQDSQRDDKVTPRLGVVFKPRENISIYASYSETFLPQSGEQFANLGTAGLEPDEFTNLEAGIKWDFAEGLSFTASVFRIEQDVVRSDGESGGLTEQSEIEGFEAQIRGRLTENWFITAGYSYLQGEDVNGFTPREIPEHTFSIWNRYQLTERLALGLGATYQDESYINNIDPTAPIPNPRAQLPSFIRVDAAAYYQLFENIRLQLNIENLFDELYFPSAHSTHQASVGAPINARFSISGRF
ncbi:MAG: TonB-dependent receptor [Opitutales bacterium]